ncbi:MAG: hypothetical protein EA425_12430 [Puniceicoccaceae bacterium]|nr:MAG: hypothetical protein EA425_12430 [Puniceicoccaceae bacterium]
MNHTLLPIRPLLAACTGLLLAAGLHAASFPWQETHARPLPTGELEYTPAPFVFEAGDSVFHIDHSAGDDANPGTRERPWKHHPWDPNATGVARDTSGAHTYVFKRGVIYRGILRPGGDRGEAGKPIRLTSDPSWGEGEAKIYGSRVVTGWTRQAHPGIEQDRDKVWMAEVDFLPRTLWMIEDDEITRLTLARWPNWREPDPNDVLREWPTWENPLWWQDGNRYHRTTIDGRERHLGIDTQNLTRPAEDYVGATVWTEWGIVMGSPYPAEVEAFLEDQRAVAFRGPWTMDMLEHIIRGNRYHLENMPWMLDEPGEFWVERLAENRGRIFLRLPEDRDPNTVTIEAGRHYNIIDAATLHHVHVSGLTFRFTNVRWEYNAPAWAHPDLRAAIIRLQGEGDDIAITHNRFEHVNIPARIHVGRTDQRIGTVRFNDNVVRHTDHGALKAGNRFDGNDRERYGPMEHIDFLRNDLYHIGWRNLSGAHGHAVDIRYPHTSHVAGNFLYRIAGWGISVQGGKHSHGGVRDYDVPLSRHLIHHNRVEDSLLKSNDWGAVETWQGGPFYVFNNVVHNPVAFKHWTWREGDPDNTGSFGHAYYFDGAFKNYLFNNIGAGRNNTLGTRSVNTTAIQNIFSFENWFFNNTFHRFAEMTRQQEPSGGRFRYLGNIIDDASRFVFRHSDPRDVEPDPNAAHYATGGTFAYPTLAYADNLFHRITGRFGSFEETGAVYAEVSDFERALERLRPQAARVGTVADTPPLRDAEGRDYRPAPDGPAFDGGVMAFVPWALYATVGEWQFTRNNADPAEIIDEHWFMTAAYMNRNRYRNTPRFNLRAVNVGADDFVASPQATWTDGGALRLNGRDQYLVLSPERLNPAPEDHEGANVAGIRTVDIDRGNFLIEVLFKTEERAGTLVRKVGRAGYALDLMDGRPRLRLTDGQNSLTAAAAVDLANGEWRHLVAEVDRERGVRFYVDGRAVETRTTGTLPQGSLSNPTAFYVGGGPDLEHLAATFDFLRVAQGTLADARTTIEELHAWQFAGPQFGDFMGRDRREGNAIGALVAE